MATPSARIAPGILIAAMALTGAAVAAGTPRTDSYVVREQDIAVTQPGPHDGAGTTTAFPFFSDAARLGLVFRKRILHRGATIGLHRNDKDEIYYVLSGEGELVLEGTTRAVGPGDAVLTRDGDAHALRQTGANDLVVFIVYHRPPD